MRGCTQEKYLEAKLDDITRTEGRDVTTLDLYLEINYLIPGGTEEISGKVGTYTWPSYSSALVTHVSLSCWVSLSSCITEQSPRAPLCNSPRLSGAPGVDFHVKTDLNSDDQSEGGAGWRHHRSLRSNWENAHHSRAGGKRKARVETFWVENFFFLEWWNDLSDLLPNIKFWGKKSICFMFVLTSKTPLQNIFQNKLKFFSNSAKCWELLREHPSGNRLEKMWRWGQHCNWRENYQIINCLIASSARSSWGPVVLRSKMLNPTRRPYKNTRRTNSYSILRSPCSRNKHPWTG